VLYLATVRSPSGFRGGTTGTDDGTRRFRGGFIVGTILPLLYVIREWVSGVQSSLGIRAIPRVDNHGSQK